MGIKNLSKFLREKYPEVFEDIHISQYHFKKVAIDVSLYLHSYKALYNKPDNPNDKTWLSAFIRLVSSLRENEVHCIFVYDTGSPAEKNDEREKRSNDREKMVERVQLLQDAVDNYNINGEVTPYLLEFQQKRKIQVPALSKSTVNIGAIEYALQKLRKHLFTVTKEDFELTKQLFDLLEVPYIQAPLEAETTCADLCKQGKVDAVLSEDTDVLAYGTPVFLTKFDPRNGTCKRIQYPKLLEILDVNSEQFLDFCIMCGTDYNGNIPGIGPNKAFGYISEHKSIEEIGIKTKHDISVLKYVRGRELFKEYEKVNIKVPYCGTPNFQKLEHFLFQKGISIEMDAMRRSFVKGTVVFEE